MPILDVLLVGEPPPEIRRHLARQLAEAAGAVLQSRPQGTWVKLRVLPEQDYAENAGGPGEGGLPVFVSVLKRAVPTGDARKNEIAALTQAIAEACNRAADNVHLIYEAAGSGRVAFGGKLVE